MGSKLATKTEAVFEDFAGRLDMIQETQLASDDKIDQLIATMTTVADGISEAKQEFKQFAERVNERFIRQRQRIDAVEQAKERLHGRVSTLEEKLEAIFGT